MNDFSKLTIAQARELLDARKISSRDLVEHYIRVSEEKNPTVNAYVEMFDDALAEADRADKLIAENSGTALTGIPFALKDNIVIKGHLATASSKILDGYVAPYDATVSGVLRAHGAPIMGRTNMDEFAMGSSTETSVYGMTKNPLDLSRVPGGSSGGSAAALAMDGALAALGSDTGGSIRQPASFCGVVGLKPTYGTVSRHGLMAMGSSLDQIGSFTRTVTDAETIFHALSIEDPYDSTCIPKAERKMSAMDGAGKRIGVPRSFIETEGVDKSVVENFNASLEKLRKVGYEIVDIEIPNLEHALSVYYIIMPAEASSNLSRYDGVRFGLREEGNTLLDTYRLTRGQGFGPEVRRRILLGTYVLSSGYYDSYYGKACAVRELLTEGVKKVFENVHAIATPTTPTTAFRPGEKQDPLAMYFADIFTIPANLTGNPAISIPSGMDAGGMPFGFHLTAPHFREDVLFAIGKDFEATF